MKQIRLWLGLVLIFIAGTVCGGVGTVLYVRHKIVKVLEGGPRAMEQVIVQRLSKRLRLSKEQEAEVAPVVRKAQQRLLEIRRSRQPEAAQVLEDARTELKPLLTPAQQERLAEIAARIRAGWELKQWPAPRQGTGP